MLPVLILVINLAGIGLIVSAVLRWPKPKTSTPDRYSLHDPSNDSTLRPIGYPVGDAFGPAVYVVNGTGKSLLWRGAETYPTAVEAGIAAQFHIKAAYARTLADTDEERVMFSNRPSVTEN